MGKPAIWIILSFYPLLPLHNVEKLWAKTVSSYTMGSQHCIGRERDFKNIFESSRNILSLIAWNLQKEIKTQVLWILLQEAQMCFNETDYVTVHSVINVANNDSKRCQTDAKNATIMFLKYSYLALVGKGLLQAHNDKCCSLVKSLCIFLLFYPT